MNYTDKLRQVKEFIEDNFDDPVELVIALGLSVEDIINLLPDVLFEEHTFEDEPHDFGSRKTWEE